MFPQGSIDVFSGSAFLLIPWFTAFSHVLMSHVFNDHLFYSLRISYMRTMKCDHTPFPFHIPLKTPSS